ncbi:MAG: tetratricopeptide repeat protein [Acidobacteria bacterium]|nr:tetratricopeptide repeat protein [Acidobacteriota bacterium]
MKRALLSLWVILCGSACSHKREARPPGCAECHAKIAATYAQTGMARSFGVYKGQLEAEFDHSLSSQRFTFFRRGDKPFLRRQALGDGEFREAEIHYFIGSGNRGRGFVTRSESGRLHLLPVTQYPGRRLGMNPGYDRADHAGFERVVDHRCLSCHTSYPNLPGTRPTDWQTPAALPEGIGCDRCHGPGEAHAEAARQGRPGPILNPAKLPQIRQLELCMQCHLETTSQNLPAEIVRFDRGVFSYRPGEPLGDYLTAFDFGTPGHEDRFEFVNSAYRMRQSKCVQPTCTTCHNPHESPAATSYKKACLTCHTASDHTNQHRECTSCHMPKRTPSDAIQIRLTDHKIQRTPAPDRTFASEPAPAPYNGPVRPYYPAEPGELYLAIANRDAARLEAAIRKRQPVQGEFYLQLGNLYLNRNQLAKACYWLEEAERRMPASWRPPALRAGCLPKELARASLRRAAELAPEESAPWLLLGDLDGGQEAYAKAVAIQPDNAEAHMKLGLAYVNRGDGPNAEKHLREALRLRPENGKIRSNLASLLVMKEDFQEARRHFQRVVRDDPANRDARTVLNRIAGK